MHPRASSSLTFCQVPKPRAPFSMFTLLGLSSAIPVIHIRTILTSLSISESLKGSQQLTFLPRSHLLLLLGHLNLGQVTYSLCNFFFWHIKSEEQFLIPFYLLTAVIRMNRLTKTVTSKSQQGGSEDRFWRCTACV